MQYLSSSINEDYIKIRWQEPYTSAGLNKKDFGIVRPGIYAGFVINVNAIHPRQIDIGPGFVSGGIGTGVVSGYALSGYDSTVGYSIATQEIDGYNVTIQISPGVNSIYHLDTTNVPAGKKYIVLQANYQINQQSTASIALVDSVDIDMNPTWTVIGYVNVPAPGNALDSTMIGYDDHLYPRFTPLSTPQKSGLMPASAWNNLSGVFQYQNLLQTNVSPYSGYLVTIAPSQSSVGGKRIYTYIQSSVASKFPRSRANKYNGGANNDQLTYLNIATGVINGAHQVPGNLNFSPPSIVGTPNQYQIGLITLNEADNIFVTYSQPLSSLSAANDEDNMPAVSPNFFQVAAFIATTDAFGNLLPLNPALDILWRAPFLNIGSGGSIVESVQWYQESVSGVYNGVNNVFDLSLTPKDANSVLLFQNDMVLFNTEYTINANQVITLAIAPAMPSKLFSWYLVQGNYDFDCYQEIPGGATDGTNRIFTMSKVAQNIEGVYVFVRRRLVPNTKYSLIQGKSTSSILFNSGSQPNSGDDIYVFYVIKNANSFTAQQEIPSGLVNNSNLIYSLSQTPLDNQSMVVWTDGMPLENDQWFLVQNSSNSYVQLIPSAVLNFAQDIWVSYYVQIQAIEVLPSTTSTSAVGGWTVQGNSGAPIQMNGLATLPVTMDPQQLKYLASNSGPVYVTATPQIAPGYFDGQMLKLKGTSDVNYPIFSDGNGLSLNGPLLLKSNQTCTLFWDQSGSVWQDDGRRS